MSIAGVATIVCLTSFPPSFVSAQVLSDTPIREALAQQKPNSNILKGQPRESEDKKDKTASKSESPQDSKPPSDQSKETQSKRMLWVVPNFAAVSSGRQLPPLSSAQKLKLAEEDSFDYSAFIWTGILAFQSWKLNSDPELGQGATGYGRYYWRGFADGVSGTFFTEAIVPALTHEDPRYYTLGHGGLWKRTTYALSRTVVTKTDFGGSSFNWSEVGGNLLEAGLSNAYYPPPERGFNQTLRNWGTQMESAALNNVAKEFWPDIRRKLLRRK